MRGGCTHLPSNCFDTLLSGLTPTGAPRSRREVALCLQRYLVFAILSCIPDRQRTLRELEVGRTLMKEGDR